MLFVTYGTNATVPLRDALIRKLPDANGNLQVITDRPAFDANFQAAKLTETQRVIAKRMFVDANPKAPFGAVAYEQDNVMGQEYSLEDVMPNSRYTGFDPAFAISRFDTREDIPYAEQGAFTDEEKAELKEWTERTLLEKMQFGGFFRIDDSLPKPWPNYPMEQGAGVAQKIVADARTVGVSFESVLEFERTQQVPRKGVLSLVEAEIQAERAAAREEASLSAEIPA